MDCEGADEGSLGCVIDSQDHEATCPIPVGQRQTYGVSAINNNVCSGFKPVQLHFRHTIATEDDPNSYYMLGMPNLDLQNDVGSFDGEASSAEFQFEAERNSVNWRLYFRQDCLDLAIGAGQYLKITATKNGTDVNLPNDHWEISTSGGSTAYKTACLVRAGNGNSRNLVGLFNMQFRYEICILKNPESGDGVCHGETPPN